MSKDRRTKRRCYCGMCASLTMYSRVHQDISIRDETRKENEKRNWQTVEDCGGKQCMGVHMLDISYSSSLFRSLFFPLFINSIAIIQLRVCYKYCSFSFLFYSFSAHPSSHIIVLALHLFLAFLLFHTFIVSSHRVPVHSRY